MESVILKEIIKKADGIRDKVMLIIELKLKYPLKPYLKVLQINRNQYYYCVEKIKEKDPNE